MVLLSVPVAQLVTSQYRPLLPVLPVLEVDLYLDHMIMIQSQCLMCVPYTLTDRYECEHEYAVLRLYPGSATRRNTFDLENLPVRSGSRNLALARLMSFKLLTTWHTLPRL